jgi:hypothetical protein
MDNQFSYNVIDNWATNSISTATPMFSESSKPLKSRCYLAHKLFYKYFPFGDHHLWFPTSGYVGQYSQKLIRVSGPEDVR